MDANEEQRSPVETVAPIEVPETVPDADEVVAQDPAPVARSESIPTGVADLDMFPGGDSEPLPDTPLDETAIQPQAWAEDTEK